MSRLQLTKDFKIEEFDCKDEQKTKVPNIYTTNVFILAQQLQVLRDHIGKPIIINSGYRTPAHNKKVGGVPDSYHLRAMAADIRVEGVSPLQLYNTIESLIKQGKMRNGGLGLYDTFVHYNFIHSKGSVKRWDYRGKKKYADDYHQESNNGILWGIGLGTAITAIGMYIYNKKTTKKTRK